jgi:hypothetical protein
MEAEEAKSPKRWFRIAVWAAGVVVALVVLAVAFWPVLLEGVARDKIKAALKRKFDVVEVGELSLSRHRFHVEDVHLEKQGVMVEVDVLDVSFQVAWGLGLQVNVEEIVVRGGRVVGELEHLVGLHSRGSTSSGAGSSRLQLDDAALVVEEFALAVQRRDMVIKATASASASTPAGPVALELRQFEFLEEEEMLASASTVKTELSLEHPFSLKLEIEGAEARSEELVVNGVAGLVTLEDEALERLSVDLHGQTQEGQSWSLAGEIDRPSRQVDVTLAAEGIRPSQLPGAARIFVAPEHGSVSGSLSLRGSRKQVTLKGEVVLEDVRIEHPKLALQQVILNNRLAFSGHVDLEERVLELTSASIGPLKKDGWRVLVSGRAHHGTSPSERQYEFEVEVPTAPCQRLLEGAPAGLLPALEGFELSGVTDAHLKIFVKMDDPDATVLKGGIDLDACGLEKVPPALTAMTGTFNHVVRMKNGHTVQRLLGRGGLFYTSMDRMPSSLPAAVTSTEDGSFWRHDGFIQSQFQASLRRNVELGQFRRGASTITMQMVKNVLLSQEKTLSRKLQELFLTWVVEKKLGKQRIMEVYLNVVEFGPGIYGVEDAADHYFGKTPLELTSLESAFLATLLPRPVDRHEMWCRGEVPPKHDRYVRTVHRRMLATRRITRAEFDAGETTPLVFSRRGWPGEKACLAAGREVTEGAHTQGAISGLLLGRPDPGARGATDRRSSPRSPPWRR